MPSARAEDSHRVDAAVATDAAPVPLSRDPRLWVRFAHDPLGAIAELRRRHGDVAAFPFFPAPIVVVGSPDGAERVLRQSDAIYGRGRPLKKLGALCGEGLVTSEGPLWARQRRLIQPAFRRAQLSDFVSSMARQTQRRLDDWARVDAQPIELGEEMAALTLQIVAETLFSSSLDAAAVEGFIEAGPTLMKSAIRRAMLPDVVERFPTPANRYFRDRVRDYREVVMGMVRARRAKPVGDDLLQRLMEARDPESGEAMADQQLRDELITLFLAGHESSANLIYSAVMCLSRSPWVRAAVEEEVDRVLQGRAPVYDDLKSLPLLDRVISETLRLYPPAWGMARAVNHDDTVDGFRVREGSNLIVDVVGLHRHPAYWENPEGFDPDRFTVERRRARHPFAYVPFGAGPRTCIGNHFTRVEAAVVLAMITQRYRLDLVRGHTPEREATVTWRVRNGVWVNAIRRAGTLNAPRSHAPQSAVC